MFSSVIHDTPKEMEDFVLCGIFHGEHYIAKGASGHFELPRSAFMALAKRLALLYGIDFTLPGMALSIRVGYDFEKDETSHAL